MVNEFLTRASGPEVPLDPTIHPSQSLETNLLTCWKAVLELHGILQNVNLEKFQYDSIKIITHLPHFRPDRQDKVPEDASTRSTDAAAQLASNLSRIARYDGKEYL